MTTSICNTKMSLPFRQNKSLLFLLLLWRTAASISAGSPSAADERIRFLRGDQTTPERNPNDVEFFSHFQQEESDFVGEVVQISPKEEDGGLQATSRIVDGEEATSPYSFYVMLLLEVGNEWRWAGCGGTLVSNCHVVTAAHCLYGRRVPVTGVFVNAHTPFQGNGDDPFHFSLIEGTESHPDFEPTTNHGDVAILKMQKCVDVNEFPPALIPQPEEEGPFNGAVDNNMNDQPTMVQVMGFGSMAADANLPADTLREAQVSFLTNGECRKYYGDDLKADMVCAGFAETGGPDACQGDSGSGLVHFRNGTTPYFVGVVSWGVGCGQKYYPGVYIYVPYYRDWIRQRICNADRSSNQQPWCYGITAYRNMDQDAAIVGLAPVQQQQPQDQQQEQESQCVQEGEVCKVASDCCSEFCRAFPDVTYRKCTGMLSGHEQHPRQNQNGKEDTDAFKRGGAGGAKHVREREPPALTANEGF